MSNGQSSSATTVQPLVTTHTQPLGDCVEVPRPPSTANDADALVFFGATGDLAYKKIFPAIQRMIKKERPNFPIIGVAKAGWTLDQLRERARDSITHHGGGIDEQAFAKLLKELRYIDGDYADPKTFQQLGKELAGCKAPAHYLAIPPSMFETVVLGLSQAGCANNARVIVEKPFGRDLPSAIELNNTLHKVFPESRIFRIDHYLGKVQSRICCSSVSRTLFWNRSGIATIYTACRSTWPSRSASKGAASSTKKLGPFAM